MKKIFAATLCSIAITTSFQAWSQGGIYRWVDENGKVHYSDKKPDDKKAKDVKEEDIGPVNVTEAQPASEFGTALPETPQERAVAQQAEREKQRERALRQQDCSKARVELKKIQGPVVFKDKDGTVYDVSEEERARREQKLKQAIDKYCK
ncbi:DUF4124 domain-containing protein [Sessilibacter sp. MAH1]